MLGFGRATSLPKIWKGTRKRKKTKQSDLASGQCEFNRTESTAANTDIDGKSTLQTISEEKPSNKLSTSISIDGEDVFKLFDEEFSGKKSEEPIQITKNADLITTSTVSLTGAESKIEEDSQKKEGELAGDQQDKEVSEKNDAELKEVEEEIDELEYETDDEVRKLFIKLSLRTLMLFKI